jgi:integrase
VDRLAARGRARLPTRCSTASPARTSPTGGNAIIRLFVDTGCRRAEIAGLTLGDVDITNQVIYVVGKGRRPRAVPFLSAARRDGGRMSPASRGAGARIDASGAPSMS